MTLKQRITHRLRAWARKLDPSQPQLQLQSKPKDFDTIQYRCDIDRWNERSEYEKQSIYDTLKEELANQFGSLYDDYIEMTTKSSEIFEGRTAITATLRVLKPEHQNE